MRFWAFNRSRAVLEGHEAANVMASGSPRATDHVRKKSARFERNINF